MEKKLHRSKTDQIIAGVCGGIAETYDIDPTLVRIIFVVLTLWGGLGIILYIIGMVLMPYPGEEGKITTDEVSKNIESAASDIKNNLKGMKERSSNMKTRRGIGGNEIVGLIIIILGAIFLLHNFFPSINTNIFWPIVLILIGVLIISSGRKEQ